MPVAMVSSRQRYDDPQARLPARECWSGVEVHRVWTPVGSGDHVYLDGRIDYLTFYMSLPWVLWRLLRPGDVVVAKTDPPLVSLVVAPVAWLRGAILVNWLQDVFPEVAVSLGEPPIPGPLTWLLRRLRNASLRMAAMNVRHRQPHGGVLGCPRLASATSAGDSELGARGRDPADFGEHSKLRRALALQDHFVVGYSGNLGRAHDVDTLFDAAQRLVSQSRIAFLIIGGGHGYDQLQQRARKAGLGNVQFLPYQPLATLSDSMAAADLHLVSLLPALEGKIVPSKFYGIAAAERPVDLLAIWTAS